MPVRRLTPDDWSQLRPLLQGFGTKLPEAEARLVYADLLADPRWAIFGAADGDRLIGYAAGQVRWLEWQAHHERAAPFYERLGYRGEACPQPEYPTFEIDFG
ncbi:hypothetical protein ACQPXM_39775 [Kribbella sp. CA-253562]|uniref:hypothetical protein n=1 Tax=Kribbella sp. CA-253562 TaxID=3239942 RepID=UPI003D8F61A2